MSSRVSVSAGLLLASVGLVLHGCANLLDIEDPAGHLPDGSVVEPQSDAGPPTDAPLDGPYTDAPLDGPDATLDSSTPGVPDSSDGASTGIDVVGDSGEPPGFWSTSPAGAIAVFFADVTGDGKADLIGLGANSVVVWPSNGTSFVANDGLWLDSGLPENAVSFADVTGDGRADAIATLTQYVYVYPSLSTSFGPPGDPWASSTQEGSYLDPPGCASTQYADVDGDGLADLLAIDVDGIEVSLSNGTAFVDNGNWTGGIQWVGDFNTAFAKIRGTSMADAIGVNHDGIHSLPSTGDSFAQWIDAGDGGDAGNYYDNEVWTTTPFDPAFFVDVNGDGKADAIALVFSGTDVLVQVLLSNGEVFEGSSDPPQWAEVDISQVATIAFADVTGDKCADLIVVNPGFVAVQPSNCVNRFIPAE